MSDSAAGDVGLTDAEIDELSDSLDDQALLSRIKTVVLGNAHANPEGETVEEQAKLILLTIRRQLQTKNPTQIALAYLAYCLDRHLSNEVNSLDEAFYLKRRRRPGGQPVSDELERKTIIAYMNVIRKRTWEIDEELMCEVYSIPSKEVKREACRAAFEAYRNAVGKDYDEFADPEKKINQTIKAILARRGVLR